MKNVTGFIAAASILLSASGARGAGTTTAEFLKISPDSRSAALGGTGASDPANGFAAFHNPALPAADRARMRFSAGQTQWILGSQVGHYAAAFRKPAEDGAWGAAVTMTQWNGPSFQTTDAAGNTTGRASYGAKATGLSLSRAWGRFSAGAGVKQVTQGFSGAASPADKATAWDAGLFARGESARWTLGAVMQNAGSASSAGGAKAALPTTLRLGGTYAPGEGRLTWSAEAAQVKGGKTTINGGAGFSALPGLSLRAGYDGRVAGGQYAGLTTGVGVTMGGLTLDYAFSPMGGLGEVQRVSVSWALGGGAAKAAKSARAPRAKRPAPRHEGRTRSAYERRYVRGKVRR